MDIRMPEMDGLEATRQIRLFNTDVIIIAQTAYAFVSDRKNVLEAGCNDYISKPINMTLLLELIKKHVNK
jgi:CheY-like chemotaxis protein